MKPKARHTARYGYAEELLLPPAQQSSGKMPFSIEDFGTLDAWLAEPGWPDNHMDVAMLEGYLTALRTWPVELVPGAWLPTVWGIRGWKVAAKISAPDTYNRFIALVMGLFHDIECRLTASPHSRTIFLSGKAPYKSGRYFGGAAWATGFMIALHEHSTGLASRSPTVRSAVEDIASYASLRSLEPSAAPAAAIALSAALRLLMTERPARRPVAAVPLNKATLLGASTKFAATRHPESTADIGSEKRNETLLAGGPSECAPSQDAPPHS
jgi:yecA family protein